MSNADGTPNEPARPAMQPRLRPRTFLTPRGLALCAVIWSVAALVNALCLIGREPAGYLVVLALVGIVLGGIVLCVIYAVAWIFARLTGRQRIVLSAACVLLFGGTYGVMFARSKFSDAQARLTPAEEVTLVMRRHITTASNEFTAARMRLDRLPVLSPSWIEGPEDIDAARDAIEAVRAANEDLRFAASYPTDRVRAECLARGIVGEAEIQSLVDEGEGFRNHSSIPRLAELENQWADALLRMCDFYESHRGQWVYDNDAEQIAFDNDAAEVEWNAIASEIERIEGEQQLLLDQMDRTPSEGDKDG
jgi:hypothetical protein